MQAILKTSLTICMLLVCHFGYALDYNAQIRLKTPGNAAKTYKLEERHMEQGQFLDCRTAELPIQILYHIEKQGQDDVITIDFKALQRVYFNFAIDVNTGFASDDCEFYLPGFWYHRNLRSPKEAPSFHTSKSWNVREDRLSSPFSGIYNTKTGESMAVLRKINGSADALTTHQSGEVILSGNTTIGYVGFDNESATSKLTFGYPYIETPTRYIRKKTLAPAIETFLKLEPNETRQVVWRIHTDKTVDFGEFVSHSWEYCFDKIQPKPLKSAYSADEVKEALCNFFRESYVDKYPLKYCSGHGLLTYTCEPAYHVQVGFCGRVLLNAFNQLEYGEAHNQQDLVEHGNAILDSYLANGLTPAGYFYDNVHFDHKDAFPKDPEHSIRIQSEGIYAVLHFLKYEKERGRKHPEWEQKIRTMLDNIIALQKEDGHFARKFHEDGSDIDASGGSTPSATSALVMGYKYFGDKRYLAAAKKSVDYVENEIISKSDYFSSTLDANCEDKEAAIAAVTATYYMAKVTKGKEQQHYIDLCKKACYFALSWYYTWDVPFAIGQMLGDGGFKTRGWGNVSVENNHVDVFVFEFPHIMKWIGEKVDEERFLKMYDVIYSSLNQLLPTEEKHWGIAKPGFYPEVVQHTAWDYGKNGKGYYNDYFAPGWVVASLWELYTPDRTDNFLK